MEEYGADTGPLKLYSGWRHFGRMRKTSLTLLLTIIVGSITLLSCASPEDAVERGDEFFAAGQYEEAIAEYTEAIEIAPEYAAAYNGRGFAYYKWGRYDRAIADYDKTISLNPDDTDNYIRRGNAQLGHQRNFESGVDKVIADYNKAISLDPNNAIAYNNRGNAYYLKDDYDRAIADYNKAINLDPDYDLAHRNRKLAYDRKRQYTGALDDYDKAIGVQPDSAYLIYGRGLVHLKLGNDAAARQDFLTALDMGFNKALIESALTNEPISAKYRTHSTETHQQGVFHYNRGYDRVQQADYDNAVADMDKARQLIDPQLIHLYSDTMREVYFQSGIAYYDTGLYDQAIILFDKAVAVVPAPSEYPATYYHRGLSHFRKSSYRRAIADFDMIIHLEQDYPDATHYRELAHERLSK